MRFRSSIAAVVLGAVLAMPAAVSVAHHSVAGQFDIKKTVTLKGVISKVDWINPHIQMYLDVKDANGQLTTWQLECVPVAMARKAGINKSMLVGNGETVTIDAFPARDGSKHRGFALKITYPDGRHFQFAADSREASA
jgi:hypothetical protein